MPRRLSVGSNERATWIHPCGPGAHLLSIDSNRQGSSDNSMVTYPGTLWRGKAYQDSGRLPPTALQNRRASDTPKPASTTKPPTESPLFGKARRPSRSSGVQPSPEWPQHSGWHPSPAEGRVRSENRRRTPDSEEAEPDKDHKHSHEPLPQRPKASHGLPEHFYAFSASSRNPVPHTVRITGFSAV